VEGEEGEGGLRGRRESEREEEEESGGRFIDCLFDTWPPLHQTRTL